MDKQIENNFSYHAPGDVQQAKYEEIRALAKSLACLIKDIVPQGREQSLAITNFWANAGIARN